MHKPEAIAGARGDKVLVVGPSWVGDIVMSQSLFIEMMKEDPESIIDVLAPPWSAPLLSRMPEVRQTHVLSSGHGELGLLERIRLGRALRSEQYDRAIVIPRSFKSAIVPSFARIPKRTGFRGEMRGGLLNDPRTRPRLDSKQTVRRMLMLGMSKDIPNPESPHLLVNEANRDELGKRFKLDYGVPAVALVPGAAFGPAKRWPTEYFAELASDLGERGFQVWIIGSLSESPLGEAICESTDGNIVNLCGETRLEDALDIMSAATVVVANDSGLMHVAAAAGVHVVAIFGSTSPDLTPPLTDNSTVLYAGLDCSPCFERECPLRHLNCLRHIAPRTVMDAVLTQTSSQRITASP